MATGSAARDSQDPRMGHLSFGSVVATLALLCLPCRASGETGTATAAGSACPLRFDGDTVGLPSTCVFIGRYNGSCGGSALAVFAGDGQAMVVGVLVDESGPVLYLPGQVLSETDAKIVRWRPDLQLSSSAREGSASLEDGGRTLRVRMPTAPIQVDGCPFTEFVGRFTQMTPSGSPVPVGAFREVAAHAQ